MILVAAKQETRSCLQAPFLDRKIEFQRLLHAPLQRTHIVLGSVYV